MPPSRTQQHSLVAARGPFDQLVESGGFDREDGRGQPGRETGQVEPEFAHMREQGVLVGEEGLRGDLGGAYQIAQRQIELRRVPGHIGQRDIEPAQRAIDPLGVGAAIGLGQRLEIGQQFRQYQPRQCHIVQAGFQDARDGAVGLESGLGELVDEVPVAVLGQGRRARTVVAAFEHTPAVQLIEQRADLGGGEPGQFRGGVGGRRIGGVDPGGDVVGVQQHHIRRAGPIEGVQNAQVVGALLGGGEGEQPQTLVPVRGFGARGAVDGIGHREQGNSWAIATGTMNPRSAWPRPVCRSSPQLIRGPVRAADRGRRGCVDRRGSAR